MQLQPFSTAGIPQGDAAEVWEKTLHAYFGRLRSQFLGDRRRREAMCDLYDIDGIAAVRFSIPPSQAIRMACDTDDCGGEYLKLSLQLSGQSKVVVGSTHINLNVGDWILIDQRCPYIWESQQTTQMFSLQIPRERLNGVKLPSFLISTSANDQIPGMNSVLGTYLYALNGRLSDVTDSVAPTLADSTVSLVATAIGDNLRNFHSRPDPLALTRFRAVQFINAHAADPEISVEAIARALNCSRRYLYKAFDGEDKTPAQLIWRVRLERCRTALLKAENRSRSVSSIAYENGFNSDAHFARMFKEHYGESASSIRPPRG